jgi:hypothetical protein
MNLARFVPLVLLALSACAGATPEPAREATTPPADAAKPPPSHDAGRARVLASIDAARADRGLPPVNVVEDSEPLRAAEREILRGATPDQAIRTALQRVVESETSEASGWCLPTHDVSNIELPSVVLEQKEVYLSVVAIRKPPGAEPPPLVVCLLVFEDGPEIPSTDG